MLGIFFAIFGTIYTVGKFKSDMSRSKKYKTEIERAFQSRREFIEPLRATNEELNYVKSDKDYSDMIDDLEFVFNQKLTEDEIMGKVCSSESVFGGDRKWLDLILEIRCSREGKVWSIFQEQGIRCCDNSSYRESLKRYYELLANNFQAAGVDVNVVRYKKSNPVINIYNLDKLSYNYYI